MKITKKQLIKRLEKYDDDIEIRLGTFCAEIQVIQYKKIRYNGEPLECINISDDLDDSDE